MIYNFSGKGTKKNAQIQKKRVKVYFYAIFVVFRLRGVAVASVFPRISLICTDLLCYPCSSVRSVGM
jgi:hypothetical protein